MENPIKTSPAKINIHWYCLSRISVKAMAKETLLRPSKTITIGAIQHKEAIKTAGAVSLKIPLKLFTNLIIQLTSFIS